MKPRNGAVRLQSRHQRGVALITAILIVALATILAAELMWQQLLHQRRVESMIGREQARQYALGGEALAAEVLMQDAADGEIDHLFESWAQGATPFAIDGGQLYGGIEDMQARLNLNNLWRGGQVDQVVLAQFQKLLVSLELDPGLAEAVIDWLDPNQDPTGIGGAEDDRYTGMDPPYRAANGYISSASELLAIQGFDLDAYRALEPHVAALLPGWCNTIDITPVNVNTAGGPVLLALDPDLSQSEVEGLLEERESQEGWSDLSSFNDIVSEDVLNGGYLDVKSQCYLASVTVEFGTVRFSMYSLLDRSPDGDQILARLRSFGVN